ncbi:MAG: alpha/beta hydrolase, partial [Clostridia bacterium]|nr:alpha/beta hydrolase [Clostridia bacterium]
MIIVGMECGHQGDERLSEYLPYPVRRGTLARFAPMGEETMQWILQVVKPWADKNLPTQPLRECTGIGGSSMGGLMALYGVLRHNRFFSKAACLSSAVGFCMPALRAEIRSSKLDADTRVFLSWGTREARGDKDEGSVDKESKMARMNTELAYALSGRGGRVRLHCER